MILWEGVGPFIMILINFSEVYLKLSPLNAKKDVSNNFFAVPIIFSMCSHMAFEAFVITLEVVFIFYCYVTNWSQT